MPATYEPIATASPSAAANVEFTSIPSGYTDLVIVWHLTSSTGNYNVVMQFNGDTGNNYSLTTLSGNGSAASSARLSSRSNIVADSYGYPGTSAYAMNVLHVMSYSNTNVFKTVLAAPARADSGVDRIVGLWRSTSAITSVLMTTVIGTVSGTVSLYGIKAA